VDDASGGASIGATIALVRTDPPLPVVFTLADVVRAGLTPDQAERRVRTGQWHRLLPGAFCSADLWRTSHPEQRHVLVAQAVRLTFAQRTGGDPEPLLSHSTAAAVLGLPLPSSALRRVAVTVPPGGAARNRTGLRRRQYVAALGPDELVVVRGLRITAPARTVADCLRHEDALNAVPIADAAVRRGLVTADDVAAVLRRQAGWPYAAAASLTLQLVDGRRESALESRSFVVMHRSGLPRPEFQVEIRDTRNHLAGRVDFAWIEHGVVGEADGRVKYGDRAVEVIEAEKDRQARLEALGLVVVRWNARQLLGDPPVMVTRLRAALANGDGSRFTGQAA
jgi:hypothetical protein